ncbi:hypothetical protein Dimus_003710 [Dionaea muscipula]
MASSHRSSEEEARQLAAHLGKALKEGERILAPTRRPDGTLRKPIRIRAGYVPQEEVAIYQSKGALWKKEMESQVGPPGYDTTMDVLPKTKSVKRNERKKEKRLQDAEGHSENERKVLSAIAVHLVLQRDDLGEGRSFERVVLYSIWMVGLLLERFQFLKRQKASFVPPWHMRLKAALEKAKSSEELLNEGSELEEEHDEDASQNSDSEETITSHLSRISLSVDVSDATPGVDSAEGLNPENSMLAIDKIIRALRKKIRLTEALQQKTSDKDMNPEQLDKVRKLEGWREELKLLEDKRVEMLAS